MRPSTNNGLISIIEGRVRIRSLKLPDDDQSEPGCNGVSLSASMSQTQELQRPISRSSLERTSAVDNSDRLRFKLLATRQTASRAACNKGCGASTNPSSPTWGRLRSNHSPERRRANAAGIWRTHTVSHPWQIASMACISRRNSSSATPVCWRDCNNP
jgi:hypothetical protein